MLQLIQNYKTGKLEIVDIPMPVLSSNMVLVKNFNSLVSIGTERSIIDLGKKSLLGKAKARPDLVKRFIDKAKKEGFLKTFQEALGRLDNPTTLGYSSAGEVVAVGKNVHKFSVGDRVACIGAGYASHSEYITVPENLCCRMPENVSFEEASFGMLGIIAMHGIRCANLSFGEKVAVVGLGLLGLLTMQILKAYGCVVIGLDVDVNKVDLAKSFGIDFATSDVEEFKNISEKCSSGFGMDAVIITAATKSDEPIHLAVDISRFRGKVVVVGVADIHPNRNEMWHKEVEIIVSKAAGPGSLDPIYENQGIDYPIGYVRWTENRNLEEFLRLISDKKININSLITHRFPLNNAPEVYKDIMENKGGPYIGVLFYYNKVAVENSYEENGKKENRNIEFHNEDRFESFDNPIVGVIGAGLFGKALLIPALSRIPAVTLKSIATSSGVTADHVAKKYNFNQALSDYKKIIEDQEINSTIILTPHSLHAKMVIDSIKSHKHTFVEKPLCINGAELEEIFNVYNSLDKKPFLMVGYNRRYSPHSTWTKSFLGNKKDPMMINYRINAGFVPPDHWVHSEKEGGNRIIGEICHFVDLMIYFTSSIPVSVFAKRVSGNNKTIVNDDNVAIIIKFSDGSIGNIFYSASGDKAFSRERIEIYSDMKTILIEDFKNSYLWFNGKRKKYATLNQEIGYKEELTNFFDVVRGKGKPEMTFKEIYYSTLAVFCINKSLNLGREIKFEE